MRRRKRSGLRGVHFGDHEPVGGLDLPPSKIFVPNLCEPMQGVDRYDDLTHHDVMLQDGVCDDGVDDAARVGKSAGFEHDVVNSPRGDVPSHPIVADVAKQRHQGWARLAAGAAARENTQPRRADQQCVIDRRDRGFVDHHQGVLQQAMVEMMAQPSALAGAEKAAENCEPHPTFARIARQGARRLADEAGVERIDRAADDTLGRLPKFAQSVDHHLMAGPVRQSETGARAVVMDGQAVGGEHRGE